MTVHNIGENFDNTVQFVGYSESVYAYENGEFIENYIWMQSLTVNGDEIKVRTERTESGIDLSFYGFGDRLLYQVKCPRDQSMCSEKTEIEGTWGI